MCGGYTSYSSSPEVNEPVRKASSPAATQSRRIDAKELALQVAHLIDNKGEITAQENTPVSARLSMVLRQGATKATLNVNGNPYGNGSSLVRVTRGRKVLLEASGDQFLSFTEATFKPGSWTKPFRAQGKVTLPASRV